MLHMHIHCIAKNTQEMVLHKTLKYLRQLQWLGDREAGSLSFSIFII